MRLNQARIAGLATQTTRDHVRPVRSIFSNALNFRCSPSRPWSARRDDIAHSACLKGRHHPLRRRATDSALFSSLVTGKACSVQHIPAHQAREWRSAAPHFDRRFAASFRRDLVRLRAAS